VLLLALCLFDMSPGFMKHNLRNTCLLKSVLGPESRLANLLSLVSAANFPHLILGHDSHAVRLAIKIPAPVDAILYVLSVCAKIKMIWSYTGRVITAMQHPKAGRVYWAKVENPRVSMGLGRGDSVPVIISIASPQPAAVSYGDMRPELSDAPTYIRAEQPGLAASPRMKRHRALIAKACYFKSTQGVDLQNRFVFWSGPFVAQTADGPFIF
jgi:hypothetical protein